MPVDPGPEIGTTLGLGPHRDVQERHLPLGVGVPLLELLERAERRIEGHPARPEKLRGRDQSVVRERGSPCLIEGSPGHPGHEDLPPGPDRMDHPQIDVGVDRLGRGGPDRRVVTAEVRVIQARVQTLGERLRRVPGPRDDAVDPVVEPCDAPIS